MRLIRLSLFSLLLAGCSVLDPNPGEKEADTFIHNKQYEQALAIIEPLAQQGVPWAQLRLGVAWEYGQGKSANAIEALGWYQKVAAQTQDLPWADGVHILSAGDEGYFYQNHDARVAQYLMARLYAQGAGGVEKNLPEALRWIDRAISGSQGSDLVFCCENSRLRTQYIKAERLQQLKQSIEQQMVDF